MKIEIIDRLSLSLPPAQRSAFVVLFPHIKQMLRWLSYSVRRKSTSFHISTTPSVKNQTLTLDFLLPNGRSSEHEEHRQSILVRNGSTASSPSLSIWRRKKEMSKEGMFVVKELKRLKSDSIRFDRFVRAHVSRLLKSDLFAVLAEFQRQDQVFLCMKVYELVRKEIWYRPDMFFYRDMLMMLARNKKVDEAKRVREDLRREEVLFDQHTYGDIVRCFLDNGLPDEAMDLYEEMRRSPDPPLSLPYRVMLKGLLPYTELRDRVKAEFLELFPGMIIYDPPEDLFDDEKSRSESEDD